MLSILFFSLLLQLTTYAGGDCLPISTAPKASCSYGVTDASLQTPLLGVPERSRLQAYALEGKLDELRDTLELDRAQIDEIDMHGNSLLILACLSGSVACVRELINAGANIEHKNAHTLTPLMCAACTGNPESITALADREVLIDAKDKNGSTALHYAIMRGNIRTTALLLQLGADPKEADANGHTAWGVAKSTCNPFMMIYLAGRAFGYTVHNLVSARR